MLLPLLASLHRRAPSRVVNWGRVSSGTNLCIRQDPTMSIPKRERWSEADVLALPEGEHDYFDRKSGALLVSQDFRKDTAKALCAFANSGGGHLVIGVEDDSRLSGVDPTRGRTPTREWLEQVIPNLLVFPLQDFRVHQVEPATTSIIPTGRVVLVVDVGDSGLAPHQTEGARVYYYREGGHSVPAPHFYLETLRNRLTRPQLSASLTGIVRTNAYAWAGGIFVETRLAFLITNTGRVAAYKWALVVEGTDGDAEGREADYKFAFQQFPSEKRGRSGGISLDDTILPGLVRQVETDFGFLLRSSQHDHDALLRELKAVLSPTLIMRYRVVTETSPGETVRTPIVDVLDHESFFESILPLSTTP
jgi:hypothetical protein